jgi:uncharacterized protein
MRLNNIVWGVVVVSAVVCTVEASVREPSLVAAVRQSNVAVVRDLLKQRTDPNVATADGTTALHWAAHQADVELVDILMDAGARATVANRFGVTPLALAAESGSAPVVARLLDGGADPNATSPAGETALMTAARTGNAVAIRALLTHGAKVDARERVRGQTALMWAASEGHSDAIKALLEGGAEIHARSHGPAPMEKIAPVSGYRDYSRKRRVDVFSPLLFAVRGGKTTAVRTLIEAGANVNDIVEDGTSALVVAIINAHYELAGVLVDLGADPNAAEQGWTALHQVVRSRSLNMNNVPVPVPTGRMSSMALTEKLLAAGADINARMTKQMNDGYENRMNRIGATPLMLAAKGVDAEMMRFLVAKGADPAIATEIGTTILMAAAGVEMKALGSDSGTNENALEAVKVALDLGLDVNAANRNGETALHGAAARGHNPIVQLLADRGAKFDVKNKTGCTPIKVANGEVGCSSSVAYRPETLELLRRLMTERGIPLDIRTAQETYSFGIK